MNDLYKSLTKETIENIMAAFDNPGHLQIFKTHIYSDNDGNAITDAMDRHKHEILNAIIFSIGGTVKVAGLWDICQMSGFLEQKGRLPEPTDRIRIIRGNRYFDVSGEYIISEIGFQILVTQPM
jgi:hypothetical protein